MATLDQYIDRLVDSRSPDAEATTTVSIRLTKERAVWLKGLAKEIGEKYPVLASAVFEDGCVKLMKVEAKHPRAGS